MAKVEEPGNGLADRAVLDKMDKLRELGISDMVSLPQMVVVGDQSAGKSSVLESLTGFHFPRSVTLCTRHATEIICRREEQESIVVSIHAVDTDKKKAQAFRREATGLDSIEFAKIFSDAAEFMGIKSGADEDNVGVAFSRDILRVEISGPNEDHLTVIDVPGMFENETKGLTTKGDIELVKNMVRGYINESRTIILAVVPCNGDIANQKILTYAAEVDPEGKRTLGVLTKPDLATENATKEVIVDLVLGKRRDLQLGYCLVKNRSADDTSSTTEMRNRDEKEFFAKAPWTRLPANRLGIPALKSRIRQLLVDRTRGEFSKVQTEIAEILKTTRMQLKFMGESRSTTEEQRIFLGRVAAQFSQIKNFALDAYYSRHKVFQENEDLKLITRIREINELFSKITYEKGHTRKFAPPENEPEVEDDGDGEYSDDGDDVDEVVKAANGAEYYDRDDLYDGSAHFAIPVVGEVELAEILTDPYQCSDPASDCILEFIEEEYITSRGYELGTFSSEMLPVTFKEQSKKWPRIARAHVSNAILIVHHFISTVLETACPDPGIRNQLWTYLLEELQKRYQHAIEHTEFLLKVEFEGKTMTYNPTFDEALRRTKASQAALLEDHARKAIESEEMGTFSMVMNSMFGHKNPVEQTRRDIHDVLHSYYDIARSRFVDVICQQVIDHFLLHAATSPLSVLSEEVVLKMNKEQLEAIAGEGMVSRDRREKLTRDITRLTTCLKIMRGAL
ncbi:Fc.00g078790.m01.CDS01 [Cosmosporella sp. VM-42]